MRTQVTDIAGVGDLLLIKHSGRTKIRVWSHIVLNASPVLRRLARSQVSEGCRYELDLPSVKDGNIVVMGDVCCGVDQGDQLGADQQVVDSLSFDTASD